MKQTVVFLLLALVTGAMSAAPPQEAPGRMAKVRITAEQANLREKPDIGSSIVQQIPGGTVLEADRKEGEWYFVRYTLEDGGVIGGWIHESLVEVIEAGRPVRKAIKKPADEAPARKRSRRPIRFPRIKMPEFRSGLIPLEISFSAGLATLAPQDLNDGTRGYVDWYGASIGIPVPDGTDLLKLAFLAGFELSYRISPRLAVGLGADFVRGANGDKTELSDAALTETLSTRPSAGCVPVRVGVRFYPGAGLYFRGALGLYAVKAGYRFRHEDATSWEQWKGSATASGLGGEAGFGGEWDVASRTVLFVEADFRMASFSGLTGRNVYTNSGGEAQTEPGTLYQFRKAAADESIHSLVFVRATAPSETGVVDSRRARINLSGAAFRVGVRYRF